MYPPWNGRLKSNTTLKIFAINRQAEINHDFECIRQGTAVGL